MANPNPSTQDASYSFLPWLRRGVINLADPESLKDPASISVSLSLKAEGAGEAPETVPQNVRLYGPGDIYGIDRQAIIRTIPRPGVQNFEDNFLCGIEFYEEDFPWRYTPAIPAAGRLSPWIWLVALRDNEFVRRAATETSLPAIEINGDAMRTAFPDPGTTWAWAHIHINGKAEGTTQETTGNWVGSLLQGNANLGCSRLLCPRRLQPSAHYTVFLIPAFEKGRLAGLGNDDDIDKTPHAEPSWPVSRDAKRTFPVYYEWEFTTQSGGDFESLAMRLSPLTESEEAALNAAGKPIDISQPGWGLKYPGEARAVTLEGALRPVGREPDPITAGTGNNNDATFLKDLENLLNLGITTLTGGTEKALAPNAFFEDSSLEDDPMIVPPLYGSFYRSQPSPGSAVPLISLSAAAPINDWYNQLNLDPALRLAAAQGTAVVQKNQEGYMDRAWDHLGLSFEVERFIRRHNYSLEASKSLFNKRFQPLLQDQQPGDEDTFSTLAMMAPLHQVLTHTDKSFSSYIREKNIPQAYSRSFAKIIRKDGPLIRRLNNQPAAGVFFANMTVVQTLKNFLHDAIYSNMMEGLSEPYFEPAPEPEPEPEEPPFEQDPDGPYQKPPRPKPPKPKPKPPRPRPPFDWWKKLFAGYGLDNVELCRAPMNALLPYVKVEPPPAPAAVPANAELYQRIATQINPSLTVSARLNASLSLSTGMPLSAAMKMANPNYTGQAPEFPEPMYKELVERSADYILPGLDQIPANRVSLLLQNQSFIESYMVGLNHEMSREYLWREFPAPLNSTPFRQFWDVRDNYNAVANKQDITQISQWSITGLGAHRPVPAGGDNIVILVRGDLLRKYPNTEVFMQRAEWADADQKTRRPAEVLTEGISILYPVFSGGIDPDCKFYGFALTAKDAVGGAPDAGWFFVLKERAGDIHFGLDIDQESQVSWPRIESEVPENACINALSEAFKGMQPGLEERADHIADMLYQQPFEVLLHASCIIS